MKEHLYEVISVTFVERSLRLNVHGETLTKKAHTLLWFPVKDIKISDNFYKIQNILRTSWASVIMHKDLLHPIIWM
jgi:hypothetical protein